MTPSPDLHSLMRITRLSQVDWFAWIYCTRLINKPIPCGYSLPFCLIMSAPSDERSGGAHRVDWQRDSGKRQASNQACVVLHSGSILVLCWHFGSEVYVFDGWNACYWGQVISDGTGQSEDRLVYFQVEHSPFGPKKHLVYSEPPVEGPHLDLTFI